MSEVVVQRGVHAVEFRLGASRRKRFHARKHLLDLAMIHTGIVRKPLALVAKGFQQRVQHDFFTNAVPAQLPYELVVPLHVARGLQETANSEFNSQNSKATEGSSSRKSKQAR